MSVESGGAGVDRETVTFPGTALVTGASRGIGLAIAGALARQGVRVAMVARAAAPLRSAAERLGAEALPFDVSRTDAVESLRHRLEELFGGSPDVIVSSAGAFSLAPIAATDPDDFDRQIAANLRAPFLLLRTFLPRMLERGEGHFVSIGSVAGRVALPGNGAYAASKYGLRGLHEVLSEELRGTRVRATLIEPSATDTPLWDALDPDGRADLPSRSSMLRADDVARAVLFAIAQPPEVQVSVLALRATG